MRQRARDRDVPAAAKAVTALGHDVTLDGEAVILLANGSSDFFGLHAAISAELVPDARFVCFDLLSLDGRDMSGKPLTAAKS